MGGTNQLLKTISELAKTGNADKKLITATKLLKVLSVDDQNKSEIFDSYGIGQGLTKGLTKTGQIFQAVCDSQNRHN